MRICIHAGRPAGKWILGSQKILFLDFGSYPSRMHARVGFQPFVLNAALIGRSFAGVRGLGEKIHPGTSGEIILNLKSTSAPPKLLHFKRQLAIQRCGRWRKRTARLKS
jgi:hypothetical protein